MADESSSRDVVRFEHGRKCPVCGGAAGDPRHQGVRCHGFMTDEWVHCTRESLGGGARHYPQTQTWAHKRRGKCPCGVEHAPGDRPPRRIVDKVYVYKDAGGKPAFEVVRYKNPKTFAQRLPTVPGRKPVYKIKGLVELVPYHLDEIVDSSVDVPVWIVEGEKDADRLREAARLVATCNPMGAEKWNDAYSQRLVGRTCYVIPDADVVGRRHARAVVRSLQREAASVRIVELPGLAEHGDVSDWLDAGGTIDELHRLAEEAPELVDADLGEADAESAPAAPPAPAADASSPQADQLLAIASEVEFWRNMVGDGYVSLPVKGGREHVPVRSDVLYEWLMYRYWNLHKRAASPDAINAAVNVLSSLARFEGKPTPSWLRISDATPPEGGEPTYFLDLADKENFQAVRITPRGWEVIADPPVRFFRPRGIQPLPTPERGGDLDELWEFCNVAEEVDRRMLIAAFTAALRPVGPYPIVILNGEHGSAKSTTARVLKLLVDPRRPELGTLPSDPRDLMVVSCSNWYLSFDNISRFNRATSDTLCRLATGGGMELRKLKTDDEIAILEATRPIVLNGIDDFSNHQDLMDRAVVVTCPVIPDDRRRPMIPFWKKFEERLPSLLGAALDVVAGAMARLPEVAPAAVPRMAEFAYWGEAVGMHLGWPEGEFVGTLMANRESANSAVLEDSAVARGLIRMGRLQSTPWLGLCSELMSFLEDVVGHNTVVSSSWPKNARSFASELTRTAPALRRAGVNVENLGRSKNGRRYRVTFDAHNAATPPPGSGAETYTTYTRGSEGSGDISESFGDSRLPF